MCGIVGLFLKDKSLESRLGAMLSEMLVSLGDRGPDSTGLAIYGKGNTSRAKVTLQSPASQRDFAGLDLELSKAVGGKVFLSANDSHAVLDVPADRVAKAREALRALRPAVRIMSHGGTIEIYKEIGLPEEVVSRFNVTAMTGTHGIGHTRMATESAVTTLGAHPFSTGPDQCLVHNGSLSNHNNMRRELRHSGFDFETDNDSEVAAAYISSRIQSGDSLGDALEGTLDELDGFFTFVVGTKSGFGVVRDPIACKPAVLAETDGYVAFGSEYRAMAKLPGIDMAKVWEPKPATVYFWEH